MTPAAQHAISSEEEKIKDKLDYDKKVEDLKENYGGKVVKIEEVEEESKQESMADKTVVSFGKVHTITNLDTSNGSKQKGEHDGNQPELLNIEPTFGEDDHKEHQNDALNDVLVTSMPEIQGKDTSPDKGGQDFIDSEFNNVMQDRYNQAQPSHEEKQAVDTYEDISLKNEVKNDYMELECEPIDEQSDETKTIRPQSQLMSFASGDMKGRETPNILQEPSENKDKITQGTGQFR